MPPEAANPAESAQTSAHEVVITQIHPLIAALEQQRGHSVIAYFLHEGAALADEQMFHLYEHLRRLGHQDHIDLWLHSRGGATEVPWKIVSLIREFASKFSVLIPYRAHSGATHIAMGADEILMTEMSELGPTDPTRRHPLLPKPEDQTEPVPISVQDLRHLLQFVEREMGGKEKMTPEAAAHIYAALFDKVHPLAIGALEQSWALSHQISERVLGTHLDSESDAGKIREIANRMSDYYKSHLYQIGRKEARELGLDVTDASSSETDAMWNLYNAYVRLEISGEGTGGPEPVHLSGLGHIDSKAASTVGLQLTSKKTGKIIGARWESVWLS